jgi:hypothetical protein
MYDHAFGMNSGSRNQVHSSTNYQTGCKYKNNTKACQAPCFEQYSRSYLHNVSSSTEFGTNDIS